MQHKIVSIIKKGIYCIIKTAECYAKPTLRKSSREGEGSGTERNSFPEDFKQKGSSYRLGPGQRGRHWRFELGSETDVHLSDCTEHWHKFHPDSGRREVNDHEKRLSFVAKSLSSRIQGHGKRTRPTDEPRDSIACLSFQQDGIIL